jgi:hypothetical protein
LQPYYIYKHISSSGAKRSSRINCAGLYVQSPVSSHLTLTGELAAQTGKRAGENQHALGGYAYGQYNTGWPVHFPKSFTVGALYLGGDDKTTKRYEGWEPMFGRWPKWSDLYIYTLVREVGVAYWTNLASLFAKTSIAVAPDLTFSLDAHHLMAPEQPSATAAFPGGTGKNRGNLLIGKLAYQMSKNVSGHLLWENFDPGDYYFANAHDCAWMRMEFMLKF